MRIGNFEVRVDCGRKADCGRETTDGHVVMQHDTKYCLRLSNHDSRRCDADVHVDGKQVGTFRLSRYGTLLLERPANDSGCFTFYRSGSSEAKASGLNDVSDSQFGVISVTFKPERAPSPILRSSYKSYDPPMTYNSNDRPIGCCDDDDREIKTSGGICGQSFGTRNFVAGGTGLSGHSNQSFYQVPNLDYDIGASMTINLRLVCGDESPRRLEPVSSNPVPAAVSRD